MMFYQAGSILLTQRREERLQSQLGNPHYLKPSAVSSAKFTPGREKVGLTEVTSIDTSKDTCAETGARDWAHHWWVPPPPTHEPTNSKFNMKA